MKLVSAPLLRRAETRIPIRMFVKLSNPETGKFEIATTIDVSRHGARVVTKNLWQPNQDVFVRSIRGNLHSRARVAHCERYTDDSYTLGLELYSATADWATTGKPPHRA
jgi:hypothetical protein